MKPPTTGNGMSNDTQFIRSVNDYSISAFQVYAALANPGKHTPPYSAMIYVDYTDQDSYRLVVKEIAEKIEERGWKEETSFDMFYDDGKPAVQYSVYQQIVRGYTRLNEDGERDVMVVELLRKTDMAIMTLFSTSDDDRLILKSKAEDLRAKYNVAVVQENIFYTIEQTNHGFELAKTKITTEYDPASIVSNYNEEFELSIHPLIESYIDNDRKGLVMFHGDPGTGKTSYIKQLIGKGTSRKIVYVPPHMATALATPSFIKLAKSEMSNCVLIVEDAEEILISRESSEGNRGAVSNLLNLTDGILAETLKMLVVCTFNADVQYLDKALQRKGRMLLQYKFENLKMEKAKELARKLYGEDHPPITGDMSLADVYGLKEEQIRTKEKVKGKFGFSAT